MFEEVMVQCVEGMGFEDEESREVGKTGSCEMWS